MSLHKPILWVGIGCQKGSSQQLIATAIQEAFKKNQLAESAIAGIATIDTKARGVGLIELCCGRNWPLKTFSAEILSQVCVPNPSKITAQAVGTPSVAEAAAILAVLQFSLFPKLLIPKQIFRLPEEPQAVTLAVACPTKLF